MQSSGGALLWELKECRGLCIWRGLSRLSMLCHFACSYGIKFFGSLQIFSVLVHKEYSGKCWRCFALRVNECGGLRCLYVCLCNGGLSALIGGFFSADFADIVAVLGFV